MTSPDQPTTVADTLRRTASRHPDRIAVRVGADALTYAELDAEVDVVAATLAADGVQPGERVAVMLAGGIPAVAALYGILRRGAVAVTVNTALTPPEVAHELTDSRSAAMVLGADQAERVAALRGTFPDLRTVHVADTAGEVDPGHGMTSWAQALAAHRDRPTAGGPMAVGADAPALIAYTSGTDGTPRGAVLTHGQLLANQHQVLASGMGPRPGEVVFTALPLFHIYALNVALGTVVTAGATLELAVRFDDNANLRFDPDANLRLLVERGVGVVVGAPPMYAAWLECGAAGTVDLSGVRLVVSGAAPLPPAVLERCRTELGLDVREGYGLTEAGPVVTSSAALPAAVPGSVGAPLDGVEVRIVDDGRPAVPGDPGLVQVRGPNVFAGYWEDPQATAAVLDSDGWLDTGDIGYLDDGLLHLVDRARDLVIVSGFNVYPAEVEAVLRSHPAVAEAAVVGVPHPETGEAVAAHVVLRPGMEAGVEELLAHCAGRLARFKRPRTIAFLPELPTLPTGKLRRRLLHGRTAGTGSGAAGPDGYPRPQP